MEWCITNQIRAQYVETTLHCTEMKYPICSDAKWNEYLRQLIFGFTNPFSSSFEDNGLYFLSFGVPAKPGIAKNLNEAEVIGRKAVPNFINSLLVKNMSFTTP